jgi:AraC family transcriptional regulator
MSGEKLLDIDPNQENVYPEVLSRPPLLSSGKKLWSGIAIDQVQLPPGETPEYMLEEFVIAINVGQGLQIERILERNPQIGFMFSGAVALCPIDMPQAIRWDRDADILSLYLETDLLKRNAIEVLDTDQFQLIPHLLTQDALIYQIGMGLKASLLSDGLNSRLYAESAATFLAVHLLQTYSTGKVLIREYEGGLPPQKLKFAIAYIQDNLAQEISLNTIAEYLGMSHYYFCRLFKQSMGISFHQYVIQQRVERAKQLLRQGKMKISDIAIVCGFSHQSHLNRHFKRLTGVTPKIFLKA